MPYGCIYEVPAGEQLYAKVKAEIGEDQPPGQIVLIVSKLENGGLRHITVWETKEQWERFQAERVGPAVGKVLAGSGVVGAPPRPEVVEMDLVDVITP